MQEYYDPRSDSWQESQRGEAFQERLQAFQEAHEVVEDLLPPKLASRGKKPLNKGK